MQSWIVIAVSTAYVGFLFAVAWWGDRRAARGRRAFGPMLGPIAFALTLAIYNTSWSFYGSAGRAALSGFDFLPIYIGPTLILLFGQPLLRKVVRTAKAQNATSISDFLAARYGKSQAVAALVAITALIGVLPYIALQLKAVGTSFDVLTSASLTRPASDQPFWSDTAFVVALAMAAFAIIFGVRHINASEHHRGLMLAVAVESLVKLLAFIAVGVYIVWGLSDGMTALFARAAADPALRHLLEVDFANPTWASNTLIAVIAFVCLPQAFHVMVVENDDTGNVRHAAWLYPGYLLILSIFMVPIAVVGLTQLGRGVNPDTYMITLPIASGDGGAGLLAFIGGLAAATGMVIVAAVSLSTMLCNDCIMPIVLRSRRFALRSEQDIGRILLLVRRAGVLAVLLLAFLMYRAFEGGYPLTEIGLVSFVAIAQLGPAFFGGLYWRRGSRSAALAGIAVGFGIWAYTLLLPPIADLAALSPGLVGSGPFGLSWARPQALFGIEGIDAISHGTLWSLLANCLVYAAVSLVSRQSPVERIQAAAVVAGADGRGKGLRSWPGAPAFRDLEDLAARFVGNERSAEAFERYLAGRVDGIGQTPEPGTLADMEAIRFTENLVAGAVGAASARIVMASSLESWSMSRASAMAMLDEASEALRFNHRLLAATLESVPQGICAFDDEFRITAWNRRFVALLGLPADFVRVGVSLGEIIGFNEARGEFGSQAFKALIAQPGDGTRWPYVYERRRLDGTILEIACDRKPEGGYVLACTDVTERHRAAEALREANEGLERRVQERTQALEWASRAAQQANASKTRFLAAASHDLLQPLNAARLFISALDEQLRQPRPQGEPALDLSRNAGKALHSAEELIRELLDISTLDSGAIKPSPVDFALGDMLRDLAVGFSPAATARGLAIRVVQTSALARTDPRLLRRILQNLLANAVRYTAAGSVLIGCRRRGATLRIEVWDTGRGIPEERQGEIFEEFRRFGTAEEGGERGLGLGLAIVDRISKLLGAEIALRSVVGRGSMFAVTVAASPLRRLPDPVAPRPETAAAGSLVVLCIDNEATILDGLAALLGRWGHRPVVAGDAAAALDRLGDQVPDVVLADFHLDGGETGLDAISRLRRHWAQEVTAIIVTADRSDEVRLAAGDAGCQVLYKPVKPASLRRFLNGVSFDLGAEAGSPADVREAQG